MWSGAEFCFSELFSDEFVDEAVPTGSGRKGFPGPVFGFPLLKVEGLGVGSSASDFFWPGGSVFDPGFEVLDDGIGEF